MSLEYRHLVGLNFDHGKRDCYEIARDFFRDNFGIELRPYLRPDDWWNHDLNLYMEHFSKEGFYLVDEHPTEWRLGDVALIALLSPVANHCGIFVEPNKILHHVWGRLSAVDDYKGIWKNNTVAVIRHREVDTRKIQQNGKFEDYIPYHLRKKLEETPVWSEREGGVRPEGEQDSRGGE